MSFSPSGTIVRLQELKLWQGSYDNLLQKPRNTMKSDEESLKGLVSLQDTPVSSPRTLAVQTADSREWDKRQISPTKPFEQMLEEKLAEDTPVTGNPKPKKPFLKKGQGLARFRMAATRPANAKCRYFAYKKQVAPNSALTSNQNTPPSPRKGILKKKINPLYHQEVDLSPLTVPDFVKSRGTWKQVFEDGENPPEKNVRKTADGDSEGDQETLENYEEFRRSLGSKECRVLYVEGQNRADGQLFKTSSSKHVIDGTDTPGSETDVERDDERPPSRDFDNMLNKICLQEVDSHTKKYSNGRTSLLTNDIPDSLSGLDTPIFPKPLGELSLEELRELKVFEALEKKVDHSSFCSTNTSVINMLASTPRKLDLHGVAKNQIYLTQEQYDEDEFSMSVASVFPKCVQETIQKKIQEVSQKTDILQQFLANLRQMGHRNRTRDGFNFGPDVTGQKDEKTISTNTSFSEENVRWSTASPSLTDNYTESDTTCQSDCKRVDVGVNTSFDNSKSDETIKFVDSCKECEELRSKYAETKMRFSDLKSEQIALIREIKDLQKEYDTLKKKKRKEGDCYDDKVAKLQTDLESERKRSAKDRAYFESYVKEAQNRPSKKEREEITQLKQELVDIKELLKLKDTKNGATQARLRTQIKQQEKELAELKITVEKLQKENAKLTASQKFARRPQDVKMLHEINKNLSKLAEETFKMQLNKSGHGDADGKDVDARRKSANVSAERSDKENEKCGTNVTNNNKDKQRINKDTLRSNTTAMNEAPSTDGSSIIVQQYEAMFGNIPSPRDVSVSTSQEKTERTLPDGSIEITYSNGNLKTISADGKTIKIKYFNGDTKETDLKAQLIKYHYAAADSWHIQYPDGTEVMEFKDGQKCTKYTDGKTEILYPDGSLRVINQGEQILLLPNGQREIQTKDYRRREYPDGTKRTQHKDGTVETVYANGRVRVKDAKGVLVMDTHSHHS